MFNNTIKSFNDPGILVSSSLNLKNTKFDLIQHTDMSTMLKYRVEEISTFVY